MYNRYWFAFKVILVIAGVVWCVEIFRRWHRDLEEFRQRDDPITRRIIIGYWIATAVIMSLLLTFGVGVVKDFIGLFRSL